MEINAKEARRLAGVDPRTTKEQFIDELHHYIKMEAERGNREMIFRIPDKYGNRYLIWDVRDYFIHEGFEVNVHWPDYPNFIISW